MMIVGCRCACGRLFTTVPSDNEQLCAVCRAYGDVGRLEGLEQGIRRDEAAIQYLADVGVALREIAEVLNEIKNMPPA